MNKHIIALTFAGLFACASFGAELPDARLTPGATRATTVELICATKTSSVRNVPEKIRRAVYRRYEGYCKGPKGCEVDHLIPLELGGSNAVENLWPQPYASGFDAHMKDKLENKLHKLVCSGQMDLSTAQKLIATDWIAGYKAYVGVK